MRLVALLELQNPCIDKVYVWIYWKLYDNYENIIILATMHLPLGLPSHLSSLLPFPNNKTKKQQEQVTKKFSE